MIRPAPHLDPVSISPSRPRRDARIDLFRGAALLATFVNHIPGNPGRFLTWNWLGFSDAAELFMLLAGLSLALAYWGFQARHAPSRAVAPFHPPRPVARLIAAKPDHHADTRT